MALNPPPPVPQPISQRANVIPALPETPMPVLTAGYEFNQPGRGTGGALTEKVKVSKKIMVSATKQKSFLDTDVIDQLPASPEIVEIPNPKKIAADNASAQAQAKRNKAQASKKSAKSATTPVPAGPIPSPISTPAPPMPIRPTPRLTKPTVKVPKPEPVVDSLMDDIFTSGLQDIESSSESDDETEIPAPTNSSHPSTSIQNQNTTLPVIDLVHAALAQYRGVSLPLRPVKPTPVPPSQDDNAKQLKGMGCYPSGSQKVLIKSKDLCRSSILLYSSFPGPNDVRVMATESFHEIYTTLCSEGLVLEPEFLWNNHMLLILLNEISTCRSELKKLRQGSAPPAHLGHPFNGLENRKEEHQGSATTYP
ncbi:hypothetical protein BJ322DRAFT_1105135 [Thelephora terrestris]|uniref:Uncharacterized protein n=1 Tax=Thelephora terrestris TaxID=56493 RepID=A0A9P6HKP7_9AGAM|nr:hypothetical protein BJ322DRAFT_1105135 [Thelephora terrestris]